MDKRFQVFISSTFADLQEERAKVQQAIMELDCIPAGMEIFPAIDEEQFDFIKKIIDDCDYYMLIIGGRYGSVSDEGISYTEMEYEYAISRGIKVIAFLHSSPDQLPLKKSEQDADARKKLADFRDKVSTRRLVKFWSAANELPGLVALSLSKTIKTYPAIGWVRADTVMNPEIYKELSDLRKENQELRELTQNQPNLIAIENIAGLDDIIAINGTGSSISIMDNSEYRWKYSITWSDLFGLIAPDLLKDVKDADVSSSLAYALTRKTGQYRSGYTYRLDKYDFQTIKVQFKALGLIELMTTDGKLYWHLLPLGEKLMLGIRTAKK